MDKVFNLEIDGQITLPDGSKLGPLYETPINIIQPSGDWPADLPKPSVGGYGYTEQGEQTVITWDGDTEGRETFALRSSDDVVVYACKVKEKDSTYPSNATVIAKFGVDEATAEAELVEYTNYLAYETTGQTMVIIAIAGEINVDGLTGVAPSDGVYFLATPQGIYTASLTYGTPDTIHKIDEKYLPASGGGAMVVVPCTLNPETMDAELTDTGVAVMDKINTDYQNGNIYPVICKLSIEIGGLSIDAYNNLSGWSVLDGSVGLSFVSNDVDRGNFKSQIVKIAKVSGEWVVQILTASIPLGS